MSMSTRLARLEDDRLTQAITDFAAFWHAYALDDTRRAQRMSQLRAAGYMGHEDDVEGLDRWCAMQLPAHQRRYDITERAIFDMMGRPTELSTIRDALARLGPHLGLDVTDSPIVIIHTLQAAIEANG